MTPSRTAPTERDAPEPAADLLQANAALRAEVERLRAANAELTRQLVDTTLGMQADRATRRAALNLMEDAVLAREALRHENDERRRVEDELRDADRRKDEFLATLAHELRNPLAPVVNGLQVIARSRGDAVVTQRIHTMLERQIAHMSRLVDDLLDVSRITRGKVELRREPVDLAVVVRMAVETTRPALDAACHHLAVDLPPEALVVDADPARIAQALANLLANAAKYTDPGGHVRVTARRAGDFAELSVHDTGVGIPSEMLPKIFDLFTQVNSTYDRPQGGLGIGLTLVRSLIELHGGSVEARSAGVGHGSEFVLRVPLARETAPAPAPEPAAALGAFPRRVLVVDDNRDSAETMAMFLETLGAETQTAHDGPSALEAIARYRPSVVLLDIGLPGMDGFEVARRARALADGDAMTLIAMTGWGQDEDRRRSKAAGFDHHLVKPVEPRLFEELLGSLPG